MTRKEYNEFNSISQYRPGTKKFKEIYEKVKHTTRKRVSTIYKALNKVETNIMIYGICKDLYENYGIEAITLHDGLYMKESDANYLKVINISTEDIFKQHLIVYNFDLRDRYEI